MDNLIKRLSYVYSKSVISEYNKSTDLEWVFNLEDKYMGLIYGGLMVPQLCFTDLYDDECDLIKSWDEGLCGESVSINPDDYHKHTGIFRHPIICEDCDFC